MRNVTAMPMTTFVEPTVSVPTTMANSYDVFDPTVVPKVAVYNTTTTTGSTTGTTNSTTNNSFNNNNNNNNNYHHHNQNHHRLQLTA